MKFFKKIVENKQKRVKILEEFESKVSQFTSANNIPNNICSIFCNDSKTILVDDIDGFMNPSGIYDIENGICNPVKYASLMAWKDNNELCMLVVDKVSIGIKLKDYPSIRDGNFKRVNMANIIGFGYEGDIKIHREITGGGVSIGGAIVGAMVAGGVGAIIGSRKSIKTEEVVEDNRVFILSIYENGKEYNIKMNKIGYESLKALIPEKEISF